jgi:hypothetical protein
VTARMTETEYRAAPGVNWSTLKHMARSPLHYRHAVTAASDPTPAMALGTLAHLAVLEPHRLAEVAVWEGGVRRGKEWDAWNAANAGRIQAKPEELATARAIGEAVRAHPVAAALLDRCEVERSIFWVDPDTGIPCKARLDACKPGAVIDLKTARDVSPRAFGRAASALDYPGQLGHYGAAWAAETGDIADLYIIAVESDDPHDVAVYQIDHVATHAGLQRRRRYLDTLAECQRTGRWPGQVPDLYPLDIPAYYNEEADNG